MSSVEAQLPKHVAIIMDGNGRWAKARGHMRVFGHIRGASRVQAIVKEAGKMGVKALSLYAFSTENWNRPSAELDVLWKLLQRYLKKERDELHRENVRLRVIGQQDRLNSKVREVLNETITHLSKNTGLQLNLCISYGARAEIVDAIRRLSQDVKNNVLQANEIDDSTVDRYLWTSELGKLSDVDLVIRTSGEKRTSNFLLWQSAYAEYVFMDLCWPDFGPNDFRMAIGEYQNRHRRFGGL